MAVNGDVAEAQFEFEFEFEFEFDLDLESTSNAPLLSCSMPNNVFCSASFS